MKCENQTMQRKAKTLLECHKNGNFSDAEKIAISLIEKNSSHQLSWKVLGTIYAQTGRTFEALKANKKAVELSPSDYEAHCNLAATLKILGKIDDAEKGYQKAILINPNLALAYFNLGRLLYIKGERDAAFKYLNRAHELDPENKDMRLLKKAIENKVELTGSSQLINTNCETNLLNKLSSNPFVTYRDVEQELVSKFYEMKVRKMDETLDARYGNGTCSLDFNLFEDEKYSLESIISDLTMIMMNAIQSNVYVYDSFFNIISEGGGTTPHNHLTDIDTDFWLDIGQRKYSMVYYLEVGDQNCKEPGILKLYEPKYEILPSKGMVVIIPGKRKHSAVYGGKLDRVMIGVNFYAL